MKYLYLKNADRALAKLDRLVPADAPLSIQWFQGKPYLACGETLLIDVDKRNETELIPFIADAFNKCDVVTINLTNGCPTVAPIVKRGLEV